MMRERGGEGWSGGGKFLDEQKERVRKGGGQLKRARERKSEKEANFLSERERERERERGERVSE